MGYSEDVRSGGSVELPYISRDRNAIIDAQTDFTSTRKSHQSDSIGAEETFDQILYAWIQLAFTDTTNDRATRALTRKLPKKRVEPLGQTRAARHKVLS